MELSTNQNTRPMKERVKRVGHNLVRVVHFLPETPLASHGDHFVDRAQAHDMLHGTPAAQEAFEQMELEYRG